MSTIYEKSNAILNEKIAKIIPGNIKNGVNIFDVTGTYEGEGGVKLFDTIAHMQADENPQEGDLATVYTSTMANLTENDEFQVAEFPETVILPSAIADYKEIGFVSIDESNHFDCYGQLNSDSMSIDVYMDNGNIRIEYTSSDGITYTRTTFSGPEGTISGNTVDFGTVIKFGSRWGEAEWNDAIGYFVQIGSSDYEGIFEYKDNSYQLAKTQLDATSDMVYSKTFYGRQGVEQGTLQNVTNLSIADVLKRTEVYDKLSYLSLNSDITNCANMFTGKTFTTIPNINTTNVTYMHDMFYNCANLATIPNLDVTNVTDMGTMFGFCNNLVSVPSLNTCKVKSMRYMFNACTNLVSIGGFNTINVRNMSRMFSDCTNLTSVPELDMTNVTDASFMFTNCNSLSASTYANITNMLPLAQNLTNMSITNLGLNTSNFTSEQANILSNKGYYDAVISGNYSTTYTVEYT